MYYVVDKNIHHSTVHGNRWFWKIITPLVLSIDNFNLFKNEGNMPFKRKTLILFCLLKKILFK